MVVHSFLGLVGTCVTQRNWKCHVFLHFAVGNVRGGFARTLHSGMIEWQNKPLQWTVHRMQKAENIMCIQRGLRVGQAGLEGWKGIAPSLGYIQSLKLRQCGMDIEVSEESCQLWAHSFGQAGAVYHGHWDLGRVAVSLFHRVSVCHVGSRSRPFNLHIRGSAAQFWELPTQARVGQWQVSGVAGMQTQQIQFCKYKYNRFGIFCQRVK